MQRGNEQALVIGIVPESKCGYYLGFFKTTKDYKSYQQGRNYLVLHIHYENELTRL